MQSNPVNFLEYLDKSGQPLLSDGGMGTMLNARGIGFDQCLDALNLSNPDIVIEIHQAYIEAGADLIQTNTFGANRYKLDEHELGEQVAEINDEVVFEFFGKNISMGKGRGLMGIVNTVKAAARQKLG